MGSDAMRANRINVREARSNTQGLPITTRGGPRNSDEKSIVTGEKNCGNRNIGIDRTACINNKNTREN